MLVLRWFLNGTRPAQLAADDRIGRWTAYRFLHEGIDMLAAAAPGLPGALLAARAAGHPHVTVDGTLIRPDRCRAPGPAAWADRPDRRGHLWWSGEHAAHGGKVQVIATRTLAHLDLPGPAANTTPPRYAPTPEALPLPAQWTDTHHAALADWATRANRTRSPSRSSAPPTDP